MLQFLPMLLKGVSGNQQQGDSTDIGSQFMQALGASGQPSKNNQQIGLQFSNATQAPQIQSTPLMQNMNQQTIQRQSPQTFNPLIQMLINGGQ